MEENVFGSKLYHLMLSKGWDQATLARKLKLHPSRVSKLLKTNQPRIPTIYRVAKVFGVEPSTLI